MATAAGCIKRQRLLANTAARFYHTHATAAVQASSHLLDRAEHGEEQLHLTAAQTAALQAFAKAHDLTPNTIVQGAWALLLSRYSGEEDVVFGATRACRHAPVGRTDTVGGTDTMIGLLINTLPVRVQVPADAALLPWLKALRSQHLAVRDYEHTPLVNVQAWSHVPSGTRLFESLVVFENYALNTTLQQQGGNWQNRDVQLHEQPGFRWCYWAAWIQNSSSKFPTIAVGLIKPRSFGCWDISKCCWQGCWLNRSRRWQS